MDAALALHLTRHRPTRPPARAGHYPSRPLPGGEIHGRPGGATCSPATERGAGDGGRRDRRAAPRARGLQSAPRPPDFGLAFFLPTSGSTSSPGAARGGPPLRPFAVAYTRPSGWRMPARPWCLRRWPPGPGRSAPVSNGMLMVRHHANARWHERAGAACRSVWAAARQQGAAAIGNLIVLARAGMGRVGPGPVVGAGRGGAPPQPPAGPVRSGATAACAARNGVRRRAIHAQAHGHAGVEHAAHRARCRWPGRHVAAGGGHAGAAWSMHRLMPASPSFTRGVPATSSPSCAWCPSVLVR